MESYKVFLSQEDGWFIGTVVGVSGDAPVGPLSTSTEAERFEDIVDAVIDLIRTVNDWDETDTFTLKFSVESFDVKVDV